MTCEHLRPRRVQRSTRPPAGAPASPAALAGGPGRSVLHRHVGHQVRGLGLVHPLQDVVGRLLQLGRSQMGHDALEHRQHLAPMKPPGQPEILADGVGRQVGRAGRDERLVAVDREIRRKRDVAVLARSLEVEVAVEGAVEELGQDKHSRASRAPARAPRDTSGPARPTTRPASASASPTLSVGRLRKARISSRRTPASGSSASASKISRCSSAAGGCLASGFWYSTWPFSRQSRPRMRTACSRMRGSPWFTAVGQSGHRHRIPLDRVPDPERPSPVDRIRRHAPPRCPRSAADVRLLASRDQPSPRRVLRGDVGRLERGDQSARSWRSRL